MTCLHCAIMELVAAYAPHIDAEQLIDAQAVALGETLAAFGDRGTQLLALGNVVAVLTATMEGEPAHEEEVELEGAVH